jgi:cell division protein ZapA (FtsZ GTPase activity inhibitor)
LSRVRENHALDQVLTIDVLGQPFTFKAESNVDDAKAVADYVIKSLDQARAQCAQKTLFPDKGAILILTALNITNEFLELKKKYDQLLQDINQRSTNLLHTLENQLAFKA